MRGIIVAPERPQIPLARRRQRQRRAARNQGIPGHHCAAGRGQTADDAIEPKSAVLYKVSANANGEVEIAVMGEKPLRKDMLDQDVSTFLKFLSYF